MTPKREITPDKVRDLSLEQALARLPKGEFLFEIIDNHAQTIAFSRYPGRKEYAQRKLDTLMRKSVRGVRSVHIHKVEDDEDVYIYMSVDGEDRYSLLGVYDLNKPTLEVVPSDREMDMWESNK